jgi:hypothetical protein
MFTIHASPSHVIPVETRAETLKDDVGGGAMSFRRRYTRPLRRWELTLPGDHAALDPIMGLFDYSQGDNPLWFDGAGTLEVSEPILIGVGNGVKTDWDLPHRYVYVSSTLIYVNGAAVTTWTPIGDGVVMDKIHFTVTLGQYAQIKAKYRRKAKCVLDTEGGQSRARAFRNQDDNSRSFYQSRYFLQEVPN